MAEERSDGTRHMPRWLARAPIGLYRAGFGWLFGRRFVMLQHTGRRSGLPRLVVLEVADREPGELMVVSGHGTGSDWLRNVRANPAVRIWTGRLRGALAIATVLDDDEARARLEVYRRRHPKAAAALARTLRLPDLAGDAPIPAGVSRRLPVVRITLSAA